MREPNFSPTSLSRVLLVGEFLGVGPTSVLLVVPGRALSVFSSRVFLAGGPKLFPPRSVLLENAKNFSQADPIFKNHRRAGAQHRPLYVVPLD